MRILVFLTFVLLELAAPRASAHPRASDRHLASAKQFPYQAALITDANWCGGVLISKEWILTSARCIEDTKTLTAILGAQRIDGDEENQIRLKVSMGSVYLHEDWEKGTSVNDIAAVGLPVPVEFTDYIKPVNLPRVSYAQFTFEGLDATTSGWSYYMSNDLHYGMVRIGEQGRCVGYFPDGDIDESIICLESVADLCFSDFGSPLVLNDASSTLIGLASLGWSSECIPYDVALFTRITSHIRWIYETTGVINSRY